MNKFISPFIGLVLASMLIVPLINLMSFDKGKADGIFRQDVIYNLDFLKSEISGLLMAAGISINPSEVVIGKQGWLFLGDHYQATITDARRPATAADAEFGQNVQAATKSWKTFFERHGIKIFKILIGPNKGTVYPEYLPNWMQSPKPSVLDIYLLNAGSSFVDVRKVLQDAKAELKDPIYFRYDTHWNLLGGGVAFRAFAAIVAADAPDLVWPDAAAFAARPGHSVIGGDLGRLLSRAGSLSEEDPSVGIMEAPLKIKQSDWETGQVLYTGPIKMINYSKRPNLINTEGSLNKRKVLWLRDSFGNAISPYMSATFSDILQVHWSEGMQPTKLQELIERWRPDYVFVTVVEYNARDVMFTAPPPTIVLDASQPFVRQFKTRLESMNSFKPDDTPNTFYITGVDPFLVYSLPQGANANPAQFLQIDLTCLDGTAKVPIQLFWTTRQAPAFNQERSARFVYVPWQPYLRIDSFGLSTGLTDLAQIRVDIDTEGVCSRVRIEPPSFGAGE